MERDNANTLNELNYTPLINREPEELKLRTLLIEFGKLSNQDKITSKKGIYIYGEPGVGKSYFVKRVLREMNYEALVYNIGTIRNKALFEQISSNNISEHSVLSMMKRQPKKIAIVMDDINSMNNGDKGSITSLIKIIRAKKTKKHNTEDTSINPIICIGHGLTHVCKKIFDLIKICHVIELKRPTLSQTKNILKHNYIFHNTQDLDNLAYYIENDLNKLNTVMKLYEANANIFNQVFSDTFLLKSNNDANKTIIKNIFNECPSIESHTSTIGESERTTIGMYWHENVSDILDGPELCNISNAKRNQIYINILNNICFADYVDRITFKKQIWKFNELSSLIKTFKTQYLLHQFCTQQQQQQQPQSNTNNIKKIISDATTIRYSKILTKYSNEFDNIVFFQKICKLVCLDIKDVYSRFIQIMYEFPDFNLTALQEFEIMPIKYIKRIDKYLTKLCIHPPQITSNKNESIEGSVDGNVDSDDDECDNND